MTGMGGPISTANSTIVTAFQTSLLHQLFVVLLIFAVAAVMWNALRAAQMRRAETAGGESVDFAPTITSEPLARRILRVSFGLLWLFDGILQTQSAMPAGLANDVIAPTSGGSPSWIGHLVNSGVLIWNNHPVTAAVAAVWVQVGIGLWLLASKGRWAQVGAVVSIGWGLLVWGFGEAFGALFAPGVTILFGAPGAALLYCFAGLLVALPERLWSTAKIGRWTLGVMGIFFIGMAVLQAWPGRGFWQGAIKGHPTGTLVDMVQSMTGTPQPGLFSNWVAAFASFDGAHGFGVNLFTVIALAGIGVALLSGRRGLVRWGVLAICLFCLADWVLIEDFGFFGGLGTDPNNMIPIIVLVVAGWAAIERPWPMTELVSASEGSTMSFLARARLDPSYAFRSLATIGAILVVLLGAAPMALATTNSQADAIVTEATNGTPTVTNSPAPGFTLTSQQGKPVSLAGLRGNTIALTFLDPVCTTDCPLIAQAFRRADLQLGTAAPHTKFIAVVANPIYRSTFFTTSFDRQEGLDQLKNWLYLTGDVKALSKTWEDYDAEVGVTPGGAMIGHSDIAYIINPQGHIRYILHIDPGEGTTTTTSSLAGLLDQEINRVARTS